MFELQSCYYIHFWTIILCKSMNLFIPSYGLQAIWTSPGGNTPTKHQLYSHLPPITKLSKLDEPDMQDTAGEAGVSS